MQNEKGKLKQIDTKWAYILRNTPCSCELYLHSEMGNELLMVVVIGKVSCFTCLLRGLSKIYGVEKQKTQPTMPCSFKCMWGNSTIKSSLVNNWA